MLITGRCSDGHSRVLHIQPDGALCSLNEQVMFTPPECRAILADGVGVISELQVQEQHIVLIAESLSGMGHIAAGHGHLCGRAHEELDAVQFMDVVVQVAAGLGTDFLPADGLLFLLPTVSGGVAVQHLSDFTFVDQPLGMAHAPEEVHHMACHENHMVLFRSSYHFVAVGIVQGNRLFTEHMFAVFCSRNHRVLVQIVGSCHNDRVHILPGAESVQIRFHIAAQFFCHGRGIVRIQNCHQLGPLHFLKDASQFRPEISGADNCITNRIHKYYSFCYLIEPCARPPAIFFWISIKNITEGITTTAEAAIITPQSRTSWPSRDFSATATVILLLLFIRIKE